MGRRPTIDRSRVIEVAERIVAERGAAALTFDAVAKAAGISKGGVQSCFGTKEALIGAMLDRWIEDYETALSASKPQAADLAGRLAAHLDLSLGTGAESSARAASLVAALLQNPDHLGAVRVWYDRRFAGLFEAGEGGRALRLALLATEGAVLLRSFGLASLGDSEWAVVHDDIRTLLTASAGGFGNAPRPVPAPERAG